MKIRLNMPVKAILLLSAGLLMLFLGTEIMAATPASGSIGDVADNIRGNFSALAKLLTSMAYIIGIGFVISSLFKFKAHKEAPTQTQIGTPIVLLLLGAAFIFLPSVMQLGGKTVFGEDGQIGGISGISDLS